MPEFDEDRIVRRLEATSDIDPTAEATQRAMERVREGLANEGKRPADSRTGLGGIFWRSRFAGFAAAAVIIAAAIIGLHYLPGPVGITAPAFGDVIENMQQMKWIYGVKEDRISGIIEEEGWASHELQMLRVRTAQGHAVVIDFPAKRGYQYNPLSSGPEYEDPKIEVFRLEQDFIKMYRMFVLEPLHLMDAVIDRGTEEGAVITMHKATYNGKDAIVYKFEIPMPMRGKHAVEQSRWVVDAQTHLPIVNEMVTTATDGERFSDIRMTFDYPDTAPNDIYELGAPRDAEIIDKTPKPSEAVRKVAEIYNDHREKTFPRYIAVFNSGGLDRVIEYRDGPRFRIERYKLKNLPELKKQYFSQDKISNSFESAFNWIKDSNVAECEKISLFDGLFTYDTGFLDSKGTKPPHRARGLEWHGWTPRFLDMAWPHIYFNGDILEDDFSRNNSLIYINGAYIDPNRDYICIKKQAKYKYAQTESGHWYPKVIGDTIIYLDENPVFPEGTFDPNYLPNYSALQQTEEGPPSFASDEVERYEGFTPLHMAVFTGNAEAARRLLAGGADVNPRFNSGATPMELAAAGGRLDMVKLLFEHGARFTSLEGHCALAAGVDGGNLEVVRFMLDNGVDVNGWYKDGKSALHHAAEQAKTEFVRLLLQYDADVEGGRYGHYTPLFGPVQQSYKYRDSRMKDCVQTARLLLQAGAKVDTRSNLNTPLLYLCRQLESGRFVNMDLLKLLIEYGADLNFSYDGSQTPLIHAVQARNVEAVRILLEAGADPFAEPNCAIPRPIAIHVGGVLKEIEQLLWKYMEPKASETNRAIKAGSRRFLEVVRRADCNEALKVMDLKGMDLVGFGTSPQWLRAKIEEVHGDYAPKYELLDEILKIRFQSGFAEAVIAPPKASDKYLVVDLMELPDGRWKVVQWRKRRIKSPENLYGVPASDSRDELEDYRNDLFKAVGTPID